MRIDHRWIIDESQRDTDTAFARRRGAGSSPRTDNRMIICASAINDCEIADWWASARPRDRFSLSLFPSSISLSVAALFPLDVSTIRRIARYCALSMPQPLLSPTSRVGTSLRRGSRVSPTTAVLLLRVRPPWTRDVTHLFVTQRSRRADYDTLILISIHLCSDFRAEIKF